jgi:hypothetical protein
MDDSFGSILVYNRKQGWSIHGATLERSRPSAIRWQENVKGIVQKTAEGFIALFSH